MGVHCTSKLPLDHARKELIERTLGSSLNCQRGNREPGLESRNRGNYTARITGKSQPQNWQLRTLPFSLLNTGHTSLHGLNLQPWTPLPRMLLESECWSCSFVCFFSITNPRFKIPRESIGLAKPRSCAQNSGCPKFWGRKCIWAFQLPHGEVTVDFHQELESGGFFPNKEGYQPNCPSKAMKKQINSNSYHHYNYCY